MGIHTEVYQNFTHPLSHPPFHHDCYVYQVVLIVGIHTEVYQIFTPSGEEMFTTIRPGFHIYPPISIHRNSCQPITQPILLPQHALILILSIHPINKPYQHILLIHTICTSYYYNSHTIITLSYSLHHCTLVTRDTHTRTLSMSKSFPRNQLGGRSSSSCGSSSHQWR